MAAKLTDDILKWTLDIDGQPAMKALNDWEQKTRSVERANKALETEMAKLKARGKENTDEYRALEKQMKTNNATIRQAKARMAELRDELGVTGMTMQQLRSRSKELKAQLDRTVPNSAEWKKLTAQLDAVNKRMQQVGQSSQKSGGIMGKIGGMMPFAGWAAAGAAVVGAIGGVFKKAIEVRTEFSKYEAVLTNTLGSQEAMNAAFGDLKKFAANTPYQLGELTDSYIKLTNSGFQPTMDEMTKMGDLAAAMGKPFDQLTEAIMDAQTGENERLKEFGIKAQKNGDKINYTFKGVTTEVDNNADAIRNYILSLGEMEGVKGGMEAVSQTIGGAISNSKDAMDNLFNTIGTKLEPIIVKVLGWFSTIMTKVSDWISGAGDGFDQLYNWFAEFYNQSLPLRAVFASIELVIVNAFTRAKVAVLEVINYFKAMGNLVKAIYTGNFKDIPGIIKGAFEKGKDIAADGAKKTGEQVKKAWDKTVNGKIELKVAKPNTTNSDAALAAEEKKRLAAEEKKKQDAKKAGEAAKKAADEAAKKALEQLDKQQKAEITAIKKSMVERGAAKEEIDRALELKEFEHLYRRIEMQKKFGQDTTDLESTMADKQLKIAQDLAAQRAEVDKAITEAKKLADKDLADIDKEIEKEMADEAKAAQEKALSDYERYTELKKQFQSQEKTDLETYQSEMAELEEAFRAGGILSAEEYERKKAEIAHNYAMKRMEDEEAVLLKGQEILEGFSSFFSAAKDAELAKAGDNAKEREKIEKKYAKRQAIISAGQAAINGALAITKILKETPDPSGIFTAIRIAMATATTLAQIAAIKSQQFEKGRYPVRGKDDNKLYSASFVGSPKTGVYDKPALGIFSERKPEAVIDGDTTGKLLWKYPHIWNGITTLAAGGVPQFANGRYPVGATNQTGGSQQIAVVQQNDPEMKALLQHLITNGVNTPPINALEVFDKKNSYDKAIRAADY